MPKRKNRYEINCDTLEWIVDIFGTTSLLSSLIDAPAVNLTENRQLRAEFRKKNPNLPNGIYFDGSHWYSIKDGIKQDSYSLQYQVKGTAHFCQTFAMMIYLNDTSSLKPEKYAENISVAISYWINIFKKYPNILDYVINEIRTSEWADEEYILYGTNIYLKNINKKQLMQFLDLLKEYSYVFVSCKQG